MKYILITSINTKLSEEEVLKIAENRKDQFQSVPGLIRKFWTRDEKTKVFQGIFEFESKEALNDYLKTDFAQSVAKTYQTIEPVSIQILRVQSEQERPTV